MGKKGRHAPLIRREYIKQYWFEHGKPPTMEHLQERWTLKRRTLHKDMNAVIAEIKDPDVVNRIRSKFLWELHNRIEDMKDVDFVKLTKHFIPEKSEVTTDGVSRFEFVVVEPDGNRTGEVEPPPDAVDSPPE